ncbi:MAG: hypothetical protein Q8S73_24240, partial [Deltaproteobacteria bacterium]|nr:hypothetical protein [Deltaproteobacteria bacterium]
MLPSRPSRWLLASGLGHAAIVALLLALPQAPPVAATAPALRVTELTLEAPPAPVAPPAAPAPEPVAEPAPRAVAARPPPVAPSPVAPPPAT